MLRAASAEPARLRAAFSSHGRAARLRAGSAGAKRGLFDK